MRFQNMTNGNNVSDGEPVRSSGEATVRDTGDVESKSGADDHAGGLEHFRHSYKT